MNPYLDALNACANMPETPTGVWRALQDYLTDRAASYGGEKYEGSPFAFALLHCPDTTANWRRVRALLTSLTEAHPCPRS